MNGHTTPQVGGRVGIERRTVSVVLAILVMLTLALDARGEGGPIVFQSTETPPVWAPVMPGGGMGGEILRLLSDAAGITYSLNYLPITRFRASTSEYIVGDPGILTTERRRMVFPIGVFHSAYFYYRPHHPALNIRSMKDLSGYRIGVIRGTLEDLNLFTRHHITVEEGDSAETLLRMLRKGRIDVAVLVDLAGRHLIREMFSGEQDDFVQIVVQASVRPIAVIVDVGVPDGQAIARRYRQVLPQMLQSRAYHDVLRKYYGTGAETENAQAAVGRLLKFYESSWEDRDAGQ